MSAAKDRSRSLPARLLVAVVCVLAGVLLVTSAISSHGTELRAGRYGDLDSLVNQEANDVAGLRAQAADLNDQVNRLTTALGTHAARRAQRRANALAGPAGLEPVSGAGVTISLDDAPEDVQKSADIDVSKLVVHQQDIQAVANALWAGGARAITIQGQRLVSTTGIKCVGNTVVLHDVPYAPPYVLSAVGSPQALVASVDASPYIGYYMQVVRAYDLGWSLEVKSHLRLPAYEGSTDLHYARAASSLADSAHSGT
jgi:uncharacterized protein YlxW (UPF0749 family)